MSKIGKRPIELPKGVTVTVKNDMVEIKGPKGTLSHAFPSYLTLEVKGDEVQMAIKADVQSEEAGRMFGTTRAHVANSIKGVSTGFTTKLLLLGTGYKAEQKGQVLNLSLGLSHQVVYTLPPSVKVKELNQKGSMPISGKNEQGVLLELESADRNALGQAVANIQSHRPPEPYKGKGVNVEGQTVIRKAGKAGKSGKK
ncbi:MAG: 50S ribosomal protein L6 [Deltaproteobacteria bacterium]|nr:50S ribosomal protein L6 [Deltaproteobacteria bacterium]